MKLGATLEPREKVNCGAAPGGAPNGKTGLEAAAATPTVGGATVEATTGAGFDVLSSEASPVAKGFGREDDKVVRLGENEAEL